MEKVLEKVQSFFLDMPITEIMTTNVISIKPDRTLKQVKEIMRIKRISGLPVIDDNRRLIGIVSIEDIIKALEGGYINDKVEERMTRNVVYLKNTDTLRDAIEVFEKYTYGRYPVVDEEMRLVGIVTKMDIITAILTKLGLVYLHDERRREVLESKEYYDRSLITGETLNKTGADFVFVIDYFDINLAGIGASKLRQFLLSKGVDEQTARRVAIATYEAETNVVIHSGSTGVIYCFVRPDTIYVRVEDYGKGIEDIELAMKEGYSTAPDYVRELGFGAGMGMANMKKCSDKMVVMSKVGAGTIVEMEFVRKGDQGENL
ncbi:CBS domain-containing protein [Pseudothermotoga thermarum]|uniref:Putative signal transduction protein with CBS domains n=1 Tax=Pseudothermotoga thermarum DSM 5069 TaxID=688269 RepID=F7YU60_9THEM|nr:CBS domain-containing protein [Pseudothermotoga thermarum]AEH50156.1 putative signal transduction protein with CBS domains [Pseudothermotoga thermarum DSM 5069]